MDRKLTWRFSPSVVEQYFGKNYCEKGMLVYGMNDEDREYFEWKPIEMGSGTAASAGNKWEDEVLEILASKNITCKIKDKNVGHGKWTEMETIKHLCELVNSAKAGNYDDVYLYQINLNINPQFVREYMDYLNDGNIVMKENTISYEEDSFCINFSNCYPDIVRASWESGKWILSIVDCKLSKKPKVEHKLQVGLYTWILTEKIKEWKDKGLIEDYFSVNQKTAYIWNKGQERETEFELAQVYTFLDNFLSKVLKGILEKIRSANEPADLNKSLCYSISQKCEWCDNFLNCKSWCAGNEPMMLIPYESVHAQNFLRELSKSIDTHEILTIEGFREFLALPNSVHILKQNVFWKRFLNDRDSILDMLERAIEDLNQEPEDFRQRQSASLDMPSFEKVQLLITAQKDEATDRVYAFAIRAAVWQDCLSVMNLRECIEESDILERDNNLVSITTTEDLCEDLPAPASGSFSNVTITITAKERDRRAFDMIEDVFIILLHGILSNIDAKNRVFQQRNNWREVINVQAYVMDNYERENIEEMLYSVLSTRVELQMREKIYELLFWLQGESLVESNIDARPNETVMFPIVVLTSVLNRLYVFPSLVANSLHGVVKFLREGIYATRENNRAINDTYFVNKLSNVLKNECINTYWDEKKKTDLDKVENHIKQRLEVESRIISAIRYERNRTCHDNYRRSKIYAEPFRFVERSQVENPLLRQLEFEAKYESLLQFVKNRAIRGMDISQAVREGKVIEAECTEVRRVQEYDRNGNLKSDNLGNPIYEYVCQYEVANAREVFCEDKFSCIFCENTAQNIANIRTIIDVKNTVYASRSCVVKANCEISMPKTKSFRMERTNGRITIFARFAEARDRNKNLLNWEPAVVGRTYLIFDYYNDFNTEKNINAIRQIATIGNDSRFVEYLDRIEAFYGSTGENYVSDREQIQALSLINGYTFSKSQERAMKSLYEKNITLLLGPPGTGKTDYISRALIVLCELYRQRNKLLRVLVSANSHSAIENVLFAVERKQIVAGTILDIFKAERFDDGAVEPRGNVNVVDELTLREKMNNPLEKPFIVGSTVWTIQKWFSQGNDNTIINDFDVIVLDEASQMRLVDSIIPFTYSNRETRLLIVGDENQLSPIIMGEYEKDIEEAFRFGSVFRYLSDYAKFYGMSNPNSLLDYKNVLTENFRMNEILVRYPEKEIYKSGYSSYNSMIATQTLDYHVSLEDYFENIAFDHNLVEDTAKDALKVILDVDYPLILCMVSGRNQVEILEKEIKWITRITRTLENCLGAQSQIEFWGSSTEDGKFGIIAPHHEHIARIKDDLSSTPQDGFDVSWVENREGLYVGTVDKLQGKEREAVIVSYGIGDIERAIGEGEFIYSRNRLNVSLTRGKKKTIVFLTEALLEYPIEALGIDNSDILEGINFICGFKKFMNSKESDTTAEKRVFKSNIDGTSITVFRKKVD